MQGLQLPQGGGFRQMAQGYSRMGADTYGMQRPKQETEAVAAGHTVGGAMSAGAGMGLAGYAAASASKGAVSGPWGAVIGAGVGILSYLFS